MNNTDPNRPNKLAFASHISQENRELIQSLPEVSAEEVKQLKDSNVRYHIELEDLFFLLKQKGACVVYRLNGDLCGGNGDSVIFVSNSLAVALTNTANEITNLLIFEPQKGKSTAPQGRFLLPYSQTGGAIVCGNPQGQTHAVLGLTNLTSAYANCCDHYALEIHDIPCVIGLPENQKIHFPAMFGEFKPHKIYLTKSDHKELFKNSAPDFDCCIYTSPFELSDILAPTDCEYSLDPYEQHENTQKITCNAWMPPLPLWDPSQKKNPFPTHAFGVLAETIKSVSEVTQAEHYIIGLNLLGILSLLAQPYVDAPFDNGHVPVSLFIIIQANSGSGKSRALNILMKSVAEHEQKMQKEYRTELEEWSRLDKEAQKSTPKPQNPKTYMTNGTIEGLRAFMTKNGVACMAYFSAEGGVLFYSSTFQSETVINALGMLTSGHGGEPLETLTAEAIKRGEEAVIYNPRITICISAQGKTLELPLANDLYILQGFLPRCLMGLEDEILGEKDKLSERPQPENMPEIQKFYKVVQAILESKRFTHGKQIKIPYANNNAKRKLKEYSQKIEHEKRKGGRFEFHPEFANRAAENVSRVAAVFAFFEFFYHDYHRATGSGKISPIVAVTTDHIDRAIQIVEYCLTSYLNRLTKDEKPLSIRLFEWMQKKYAKQKGGVTESTVKANAPRSIFPKDNQMARKGGIEQCLIELEDHNYIRSERGKTRGKTFFINPKA